MDSHIEGKESFNLTAEEKSILQKTGMPPIFAQFLKEKSKTLGTAFALRASSPMQRYLMPAAPKPSSVKAKTGNWGFGEGIIAVDAGLGKTEKINGKWQLIERRPNELPPKNSGIIHEVIHKLSLQEVLAALNGGRYYLVGTEADIHDSAQLVLKPKFKFPTGSEIIFRINLAEDKSRIEKQCPVDYAKLLVSIPAKEPEPAWWDEAWGKFADCLDNYYPAQFIRPGETEFKDILAYGVADRDGKILPITGDQDLLWISVPTKQHEKFLKDFEQVINTFEEGGVENLYMQRVALHLKLGGDLATAEKSIHNQSLAGMGCITPYESYVIDDVNYTFTQYGVKHLRNLIQHAAENHNPDKMSPLDANMIHVWRGEIAMTHNENELIEFVMQPAYQPENIVNIHPKWDMAKWSEVINAQLILKQPVPYATYLEFKKFRQKNKAAIFFNLPHWIKRE